MSNKKETILYVTVTLSLLLICSIIVFLNRSQPTASDNEGQDGNTPSLNRVTHKPVVRRKWKDHKPNSVIEKPAMPEEVDVNAIADKLRDCSDDDEKYDLMADLTGSKDSKVIDIVTDLLDDSNEDIKLEALDLLAEFENEEIFAPVTKALDDKSEEVRKRAIELLDTVHIKGGSNNESDILARGIEDKAEEVRNTALNVLFDKPAFEIDAVAEKGIESPHPEVKQEFLNELTTLPTMARVDIIMKGLKDSDDEFRDNVLMAMENLTDQEFHSPLEAQSWWTKNRNKFEEEFAENEDQLNYDPYDDDEIDE